MVPTSQPTPSLINNGIVPIKIKIMLQNFFKWITQSSTDPTKVSLTAQSLLVGYVPIVLTVSGFFPSLHSVVTADSLTSGIHAVVAIINGFFMIVAGLMFIYGFLRKLYITYTNPTPELPPTPPQA